MIVCWSAEYHVEPKVKTAVVDAETWPIGTVIARMRTSATATVRTHDDVQFVPALDQPSVSTRDTSRCPHCCVVPGGSRPPPRVLRNLHQRQRSCQSKRSCDPNRTRCRDNHSPKLRRSRKGECLMTQSLVRFSDSSTLHQPFYFAFGNTVPSDSRSEYSYLGQNDGVIFCDTSDSTSFRHLSFSIAGMDDGRHRALPVTGPAKDALIGSGNYGPVLLHFIDTLGTHA